MLLVPSDKPFDYRQPPRLSLGLAALLLLLFAWLMPKENAQLQQLNSEYQQQLLAIEWPLYPTHLLQQQQTATLEQLKTAYEQQQHLLLMQQIGFDRSFVKHVQSMGENYLEPEQLSEWQNARQTFDQQRDQLSSQVLGLDPQRFRPITYMTYAFVDVNSLNVLASVLLLLLVGMAVEWALGSGALLSAWLVGSIVTGLSYHLSHFYSVTPLIGSTGAVSAVLGLAFMCFWPRQSLTIIGSKIRLGGWLCLALFMVLATLNFIQQFDSRLLLAHSLSFLSGIAVCVLYHRWFVRNDTAETSLIIIDDNAPSDLAYREQLHHALEQIRNFNFSMAEQELRDLAEKYPQDKRVQESLYHLCKFRPSALEFEELACSLFNLPNQAAANHVALRIYNDYKRRSKSFVALDTDTCLQLAMRFARIRAFKEAEEIFKRALESKQSSALLKKAALNLQQAFLAQQQEQRAMFYQNIANQQP